MDIRQATADDAAGIATVHIQSWQTSYRGIIPDSVLDKLDSTYERRLAFWNDILQDAAQDVFVASDETGVLGFASGGAERDGIPGYDGELFAIYLRQSAQRRGIGQALTQRIAAALDARGFKSMLVWVLKDNPAVAFYRALGGEYVSEKALTIGGKHLLEEAYGWPSLALLLGS